MKYYLEVIIRSLKFNQKKFNGKPECLRCCWVSTFGTYSMKEFLYPNFQFVYDQKLPFPHILHM